MENYRDPKYIKSYEDTINNLDKNLEASINANGVVQTKTGYKFVFETEVGMTSYD